MVDFSFIEDETTRQKAIDVYNESLTAKINEEVAGLKRKNEELLGEKKSVQQKLEEINKRYDGIDPEIARKALDKIKKDEGQRLRDEGKDDDYLKMEIQNRVAAIERDYQSKLESEEAEKKQYFEKAVLYENKFKEKIMEDKIRAAAMKSGCYSTDTVLQDICDKGKRIFQLNAHETDIEARDKEGGYAKTEDGKILTPDIWLNELRKTHSHYFPPSEGTGAKGTSKGGSTSDDIFERMKAAAKNDPKEYMRLREIWMKKQK